MAFLGASTKCSRSTPPWSRRCCSWRFQRPAPRTCTPRVPSCAGAFLSLLAGFFGMKAATYANVRTTEAARAHGMAAALVMALDGGAVMGLCVAGLGLIGLGVHLPGVRPVRRPHAGHGHPRLRGGRFLDRALRAHRRRHLHQGCGRRRRHRGQGRGQHPRGRSRATRA